MEEQIREELLQRWRGGQIPFNEEIQQQQQLSQRYSCTIHHLKTLNLSLNSNSRGLRAFAGTSKPTKTSSCLNTPLVGDGHTSCGPPQGSVSIQYVESRVCRKATQSCDGGFLFSWQYHESLSSCHVLASNCQNNMQGQSSTTSRKYVHTVHSVNTHLAACTPLVSYVMLCLWTWNMSITFNRRWESWSCFTASSSKTASPEVLLLHYYS